MDPFCLKQFDPKSGGVVIPCSPEDLEERLNKMWGTVQIKDGYAPFCKHVFMENFTTVAAQTIQITEENKGLMESGYEARTAKELAVLTRWFPLSHFPDRPPARYLDLILYSKAQIQAENAAMQSQDPHADIPYEYGIVAVKPQDEDYELPMQPITMLRNALGTQYGGSGHPLEPEKYEASVQYWSRHAVVR